MGLPLRSTRTISPVSTKSKSSLVQLRSSVKVASRIYILPITIIAVSVHQGPCDRSTETTTKSTSIALGLKATLHWRYSWVPVLLGLTGTGVLLYGSFLLVREARLAVDSLMQETASAREAVEKS